MFWYVYFHSDDLSTLSNLIDNKYFINNSKKVSKNCSNSRSKALSTENVSRDELRKLNVQSRKK